MGAEPTRRSRTVVFARWPRPPTSPILKIQTVCLTPFGSSSTTRPPASSRTATGAESSRDAHRGRDGSEAPRRRLSRARMSSPPSPFRRRLAIAAILWLAAGVLAAVGLGAAASPSAVASAEWWKPPQHLTWYWQLQGTVKNARSVAAYDIDGFENSSGEVSALHTLGKHVI